MPISDDVPKRQPPPADSSSVFAGLAAVLWTVRAGTELVLFKLTEFELVLGSGSPRWLPRAEDELHGAVEELSSAELLRSSDVDAIVHALRLKPGVTLAELALLAPEPWPQILQEHRVALRGLTSEVDAAARRGRRLLSPGARRHASVDRQAPQSPPASPSLSSSELTPDGRSGVDPDTEAEIDEITALATEAATRAAYAAIRDLPHPSLKQFLV